MKRAIGTLYLGIILAAANQAQAGLLGIEWDTGNLYRISTVDASLTLIGNTELINPDSLEFDAHGTLYTTTNGVTGTSALYTLDTNTAGTTPIGNTGMLQFEGAIAFAPDGTAYGAGQGSTDIYTIDLNTGVATVIGDIGFRDVSGLAFRSDGTLVAIEGTTGNHLFSIDLVTFATSNIADLPTIGGIGGLTAQGNLAYLATGLNAGGTNSLYSIDLFTGATSLIGGFGLSGNGISGLALEPAQTPEPATLALLGLGLLLVGAARRRR